MLVEEAYAIREDLIRDAAEDAKATVEAEACHKLRGELDEMSARLQSAVDARIKLTPYPTLPTVAITSPLALTWARDWLPKYTQTC